MWYDENAEYIIIGARDCHSSMQSVSTNKLRSIVYRANKANSIAYEVRATLRVNFTERSYPLYHLG